MKRQIELEFSLDDRDQDKDRESNPDLGVDGIGRSAEEGFDPEMIFDPLEENSSIFQRE